MDCGVIIRFINDLKNCMTSFNGRPKLTHQNIKQKTIIQKTQEWRQDYQLDISSSCRHLNQPKINNTRITEPL